MRSFYFDSVLLPSGWANDVHLTVDAAGDILAINTNAEATDATHIPGVVLPGMPNLHSHAFQRALAGLAEYQANKGDSFWSWRRIMYDFVGRVTPEQLNAIAAQLYLEMLKSGYTSVAEFHYVHHDPQGQPYADTSVMSESIIQAAKLTGIGLTHLPVFYQTSGFGQHTATPEQRRFTHADVSSFLKLVQKLRSLSNSDPQIDIGIAPHSLRAVPSPALIELIDAMSLIDAGAVVHMHVAEQLQEVSDCVAHTGLRPVEWLLAHLEVDSRWCLIHATHLTKSESAQLASSGAIAGLCPTTEANLGDGLFPLAHYLDSAGSIGVGSDCNSSVSPVEELRWLEYGQRLISQQRNVAANSTMPHVGRNLWQKCSYGGAQALGKLTGSVEPGYRADFIILDQDHPILMGRQGDQLLDSFIFSGNSNPVTDVICGGAHVIEKGHHTHEESIATAFLAAVSAAGQ